MKVFEKVNVFHLLAIISITLACCTRCAPDIQPVERHSTPVEFRPSLDDIAMAKAQWRQEEGEFQPNLTPETELYLRQKMAEMQR